MANARKGQTVFAVPLRGFCSVPFIFGVVSLARLGSPTPTTQTRGHVGEPREQAGKHRRVSPLRVQARIMPGFPFGLLLLKTSVCRVVVAPCSTSDAILFANGTRAHEHAKSSLCHRDVAQRLTRAGNSTRRAGHAAKRRS